MSSSSFDVDIKNNRLALSSSYYKSRSNLPTSFITAAEAHIPNLSPSSLLSYCHGFHRSNFFPKLTPDQISHAMKTQTALPTWSFNLHGSMLNGDPRAVDYGFHYKSPKFFFKSNISNRQVSVSTGLEVWREATIANGILRWRAGPDIYMNNSSSSFWRNIYDIQQWVQLLRIANPGVRFVDLHDHNGRVLHRIDLLQSKPGRPAFLKEDPQTHSASDFHQFASSSPSSDFMGNKKNTKRKPGVSHIAPTLLASEDSEGTEETESLTFVNTTDTPLGVEDVQHFQETLPTNSNSPPSEHTNDDDDDDDDDNLLYETVIKLHKPTLPIERQRQRELLQNPHVTPLQPIFNYIQNSINHIDLSQYSAEQLEAYLIQVHDLYSSLPRIYEGMEDYEVYRSIQALLHQLPFPSFYQPTEHPASPTDPEVVKITTPTTPDHPPNPTIAIAPESSTTTSNSNYIVNNGDPFDMSNVSDSDLLRLPRSDTPYSFNPDPYYISAHTVLLTTAKLLQLPTIFKYLNIHASLHYSYIPDDVVTTYKPSHVSKANKLRRLNANQNQQENTAEDGQVQAGFAANPDFAQGEHRASMSCHIHTHNDKFHAIFAGSPSDEVYSGRLAFVIDDPSANLGSFHPEHPLSLDEKPFFKHPAQEAVMPEVYFIDGETEDYYRKTYLPCTQHVLGLQALVYPGILPIGYDPLAQPNENDLNRAKPTLQQQLYQTQVQPPLLPRMVGKIHRPFERWYRKFNIQTTMEFQYAYVRPVNFSIWDLFEQGAECADASLDWISLKSQSFWSPTYQFPPITTRNQSTHQTTPEAHGNMQYTSTTDQVQIPLQPDTTHLSQIDITAPISTLIQQQQQQQEQQQEQSPQSPQSTKSTVFKSTFNTIAITGLDVYKKMINLAPWMLSNKQITTTDIAEPSGETGANSTTLTQSVLLGSFYSATKQVPYQRNLTIGCNVNTNGVVQGHSSVDLSNNLTLSACCEVDLSRTPTGAIRPLTQQPTATVGVELSFTTR